jgi:hypothetical protein
MAATIIGVMPRGYAWPEKTEIWLPITATGDPGDAGRTGHNWRAMGRLQPGSTAAQAQAEVGGIERRIKQQYPSPFQAKDAAVVPLEPSSNSTFHNSRGQQNTSYPATRSAPIRSHCLRHTDSTGPVTVWPIPAQPMRPKQPQPLFVDCADPTLGGNRCPYQPINFLHRLDPRLDYPIHSFTVHLF